MTKFEKLYHWLREAEISVDQAGVDFHGWLNEADRTLIKQTHGEHAYDHTDGYGIELTFHHTRETFENFRKVKRRFGPIRTVGSDGSILTGMIHDIGTVEQPLFVKMQWYGAYICKRKQPVKEEYDCQPVSFYDDSAMTVEGPSKQE